ncbi:MAG TPA: zf-HC2 domain-containing protein [Gemmatimonadales bacterium]|nr:zf-HC2 domain-containing protein [Gemmatimonadales bacterium]
MNCCEFREQYSDFADGLLPPSSRAEADAHLALCPACRRFDAALRAGVTLLRGLPSVGVSRGFGPRLRRRLRGELAVRMPGMVGWSGAVGALLIVAAAGFIGWDWLETRAAHRGAGAQQASGSPGWVAAANSASHPGAGDPGLPPDLPRIQIETFHPLNSILVIEQAPPAPGQDRVRFDVPAVWGGP